MLRSIARRPLVCFFFCCCLARTSTSAPPATVPTTTAAAGRAQLRGSRMAEISQSASSSAAASVSSARPRSSRSLSRSGGSTGVNASLRSRSTRSASLILLFLQGLFELLDRSVNQHLRGPVGAAERPCDLAVVHVQGEAHDQGLAAVVGEVRHTGQDLLYLLPLLDHLLGAVRRGEHGRVLELGHRPPGAVAVVVGGEVVGDADQPRPERTAVRLALRALEVAVGLKEGLLRQVLGVVVVAHRVVGIAVDVAQVGAVELRELAVEPLLLLGIRHPSRSLLVRGGGQAARVLSARRSTGTASARFAGSPPSHSHWSCTHGQMRSVTAPASRGDGASTFGKVKGAPQRTCTLTGLIRQPSRARSEPITATGTT